MAVEARHLDLFPSQLISNREAMNSVEGNPNLYATAQAYGYGMQMPRTIAAAGNLIPSTVINDSFNLPGLPKSFPKKSDSGITTYNQQQLHYGVQDQTTAFSRKRPRESLNDAPFPTYNPVGYVSNPSQQFIAASAAAATTTMNRNCSSSSPSSSFSFLGEDVSLQIHQQQFDIDRLISQHMEKVRIEIEERRKRQARKILEAIETGVAKRLRAKEEEIEKIGKLNWALEEKVKFLCVENQIWRDLAQSNEATVKALRSNLEQVLAVQVKNERTHGAGLENDNFQNHHHNDDDQLNDVVNNFNNNQNELADDAQSCCGSNADNDANDTAVNGGGGTGWRTVGERGCVGLEGGKNDKSRKCRNCGKGECCVLLLPCRHLCLCSVCGSSLHTCPICKSNKNATVSVNMSS